MGECVVCEQQITNPLSPERLAEQIKTWLLEIRVDLVEGLEDASSEFLPVKSGDDRCIITGKKMNVCTYCYTEHIFNWLLTTKPEKEMLEQYLVYFNFDEGRKGYYKTAEELGIVS